MIDGDPTRRSTAEALDSADPLAPFRDEFHVADDSLCYLDGNSLGRLPLATIDDIRRFLTDEWGERLVTGWDDWLDESESTGDLLARGALGAAPGQTLVCDTTSVNFYQACAAALRARPDRRVVISDTANFPTDRYVLQGLCERDGRELVLLDDEDGEGFVTSEALAAALDERVALVTLSVVQYRSGALHDVAALTRLAHDAGALVVWDASHAVGVVPLTLDADDVDLAVGCTYKYGNSGPGSPAWLYVARRLQDELRVPIQGWFAQADQFAMAPDFDRTEGIRGFQVASPPLLGLRCVRSGFSMIERAGIERIAAKAAVGTELMIALADAWLAKLGFALVTPRDPRRRGGHVTLRHLEARAISVALRERSAVVADFRRPDCLRLAISPLATSYVEVWEGFARLRELVATGAHRDAPAEGSRVT